MPVQQLCADIEEKHWMIHAVRELLIPALERTGFRHLPFGSTKIKARELRPCFPSDFCTDMAPAGLDIVEPYFLGRRKFSLNAARVPLKGIDTVRGHCAAEDCLATWNDTWSTLYRCPFFLTPFSAEKLFGGRVLRADVERVVRGVVDLLPEVEAGLNEGVKGRHLKKASR